MPNSPHSSTAEAERKRLEYERQEVKRALSLLRAQLVSDEYVDDMLSASELLEIRQALLAEFERLRQIASKFYRGQRRIPTDEELKRALGI